VWTCRCWFYSWQVIVRWFFRQEVQLASCFNEPIDSSAIKLLMEMWALNVGLRVHCISALGDKQLYHQAVWPSQYAPAPASGDWNSHQERPDDLWPLWCGSSYSIHIPSLKFVGLPVPRIMVDFRSRRKLLGHFDLLSSKWPASRGTRVMVKGCT